MTLSRDLHEILNLGGLPPKKLVRRVYKEINTDDCVGYAARLAYYFLFALFPFFIFLAALLAYIPIPDLLQQIMATIGHLVPGTALEIIQDYVGDLVTYPRGGLLSFGILLALWSASSSITAMTDSLNHAYGVKEGRPFWKVRGTAILLTIGLALLLIAATAVLVLGPELSGRLADHFGMGPAVKSVWLVARWPIILFLMIFVAALIYYFAPDVEQKWRWVTPGSVFAVLVWILLSLLFAYYVDNFGEYDKVYGSIGAVMVLLLWMFLSGFVLLVGGEINAEIEHAAASGKRAGAKKLSKKGVRRRRVS